MHDLEVAFQSDDDKAENAGRDSEPGQSNAFKQDANCAVENWITVVVIAARPSPVRSLLRDSTVRKLETNSENEAEETKASKKYSIVVHVVIAVRNHEDKRAHKEHGGEEVRGALVSDECVDTAAELAAGADQHREDCRVGDDTDDSNDQTQYHRRLRRH